MNYKKQILVILYATFHFCVLMGLTSCAAKQDLRPGEKDAAFVALADTQIVIEANQNTRGLPMYRLGFGDEIEVKVFNHPEFNEQTIIRPDGRIALEKAGEIVAIGRTPHQIDSLITKRYSRFLRRPQVTVLVRKFGVKQFYILGEVKNPGVYELYDGMTVLRAIASAGGNTGYAQMNSIILMRNEFYRNPIVMRMNLTNLPKDPNPVRDRLLIANDIIYIPRTYIGELNGFIERFVSKLIAPPLDLYLRTILYTRILN